MVMQAVLNDRQQSTESRKYGEMDSYTRSIHSPVDSSLNAISQAQTGRPPKNFIFVQFLLDWFAYGKNSGSKIHRDIDRRILSSTNETGRAIRVFADILLNLSRGI